MEIEDSQVYPAPLVHQVLLAREAHLDEDVPDQGMFSTFLTFSHRL